jgi:hypothetical protein
MKGNNGAMRREDYGATLILMGGLAAATITGFLREAALAGD